MLNVFYTLTLLRLESNQWVTNLLECIYRIKRCIAGRDELCNQVITDKTCTVSASVQLISLHLEQREYLRDGVDQTAICLSPRKPTGY